MICDRCGSENTACIDTRQREDYRYRKYECRDCKRRMVTYELPLKRIVKIFGAEESFREALKETKAPK